MFETLMDAVKHYAECIGCSVTEAKGDAERAIALMMEQEHCSREFAEATWMEETEELDKAELDKMDKVAKENGSRKNYATAEKPKAKRERKPNEEKREIIARIAKLFPTAEITNIEREITFNVGENSYSVTLTCHRKKS